MRITIVSPIKLIATQQSGISIRIQGIFNYLKARGHHVYLTDKYSNSIFKSELIYCLVSTKRDSITTRLIKELKPSNDLILDLYTPILLEKNLSYVHYLPKHWINRKNQVGIIKHAIEKSRYFIVANKRQKDYWFSQIKRWNIKIKKKDISVIPTGHNFHLKKNKKGKVILWFGGIYPWLDPTPLAFAFLKIAHKIPDWRLRILGGYYEGTGYNKIYQNFTEALAEISEKQKELIVWQTLDKLPKYLEDVSIAVHLPKNTKEDYYAHRVRLLTLTNSQIPVLTSGKDIISKIILYNNAGMNVSSRPDKLAKQLIRIVKNPKLASEMTKNTLKVEREFLKEQFEAPIF